MNCLTVVVNHESSSNPSVLFTFNDKPEFWETSEYDVLLLEFGSAEPNIEKASIVIKGADDLEIPN